MKKIKFKKIINDGTLPTGVLIDFKDIDKASAALRQEIIKNWHKDKGKLIYK